MHKQLLSVKIILFAGLLLFLLLSLSFFVNNAYNEQHKTTCVAAGNPTYPFFPIGLVNSSMAAMP